MTALGDALGTPPPPPPKQSPLPLRARTVCLMPGIQPNLQRGTEEPRYDALRNRAELQQCEYWIDVGGLWRYIILQ
jgi:hypothetical protein